MASDATWGGFGKYLMTGRYLSDRRTRCKSGGQTAHVGTKLLYGCAELAKLVARCEPNDPWRSSGAEGYWADIVQMFDDTALRS